MRAALVLLVLSATLEAIAGPTTERSWTSRIQEVLSSDRIQAEFEDFRSETSAESGNLSTAWSDPRIGGGSMLAVSVPLEGIYWMNG